MSQVRNRFEVQGSVTVISVNGGGLSNASVLVDTGDLPKLLQYPCTWYALRIASGHVYVRAGIRRHGRVKYELLHRFLLDAPPGLVVDHINHDGLDNRRRNLRIVTHAENEQNRRGAQANSKTGVRGVCWDAFRRKWKVQVEVYGKKHFVGRFEDFRSACEAARAARARLMPLASNL